MIRIPAQQVVPRFNVPVKYSHYKLEVECYLFFIAPLAMLYEKLINVFFNFWYSLIIDSSKGVCAGIMIDIESIGHINLETHKLELDVFELGMLERRINARLKGKKK